MKMKSSGHESGKAILKAHNYNEWTQVQRKWFKKLRMCRNSWSLKRNCTKQSIIKRTGLLQESTDCRVLSEKSLEIIRVWY